MIIFLFSVLEAFINLLSYEEKSKNYEDKKRRNKKYYGSVSWK